MGADNASFYLYLWIKKAASWGSPSAPGPHANHKVTGGKPEAGLGRGPGALLGRGRVFTWREHRSLGAVAAVTTQYSEPLWEHSSWWL